MNVWNLPGPSAYLETIERSVRDGESVVLRVPEGMPTGLENALRVVLGDCGQWDVVEAGEASDGGLVLRRLCERYAPGLAEMSGVAPLDLCETDDFSGRLVWVDGLDSANWTGWRTFLDAYAQASRGVAVLRRSLFLVPLCGTLRDDRDEPGRDVALVVHDWRGVVDEMDLLFLANGRLRDRSVDGMTRRLLAMTVARIAIWDCELAERLAEARAEDVLSPQDMLRDIAREWGWTCETRESWDFGTESGDGVMHAALAAIKKPGEVERRVWSAQTAVFWPEIELRRQEIVQEHRCEIENNLRRTGEAADPEELEIGDLGRLSGRAGFNKKAGRRIRELRYVRNALAHCRPLTPAEALAFIRA